jgi:Holliday junction resolvase RusA-like endonuclease
MDDTLLLDMFVPGKCEPQGSATAFVPLKDGWPMARGGRLPDGRYRHGSVIVNVTSDNAKLKGWRAHVEQAAIEYWGDGREPLDDVDLAVECDFYLKRPEGHWGTGRNAHLLKDGQPARPRSIPDVDKLLRAILDGLSEIVYRDDSLVTAAPPEKHYAIPDGTEHQGCGVRIRVFRRAVQLTDDLPPEQRVRVVPGQAPAAEDEAQLALA